MKHDIIEFFKFLLQRFQDVKGKSNERGSEFIHENVELLYYYLHKISLKRGKSYRESPEWLNKNATINPENKKDGKCFQYALTTTLNHQNIGRNTQRISKIKRFFNQYNWKGTDFPSHQKVWEKFILL